MGEDEIVVPPELTEEEVLRALGNVPRIVVGILERWGDTLRVMNHWFPWIDFSRDKNRLASTACLSMMMIVLKLLTLTNHYCEGGGCFCTVGRRRTLTCDLTYCRYCVS